MTVVVQTPYNAHLANGVTTTFGFTFQLLDEGDLQVSLDGVVQMSGYTISGLGVQAGGSVTFLVAPANNVLVELQRTIPLARSTDYQQNGDLPSDQVDRDFDRLWQALQDQAYYTSFTIALPPGDAAAPMILPTVAERASKFFAFNALGEAIAALGVPDVPTTAFAATLLDDPDAAAARVTLGLGPLATSSLVSIAQGGTGQTTASGAFNALKQAATTTDTGVVELATDVEAAAGIDTVRATTPSGLAAHATASDLGRGQTWQSVTRTAGVTYTNTTGRPIAIAAVINGASASCSTSIVINGGPSFVFANAAAGTGPVSAAGMFLIPPGATYVLSDLGVSARSTYELR